MCWNHPKMAEREAEKSETYADIASKKTLSPSNPDEDKQARSRSTQNLSRGQGSSQQDIKDEHESRIPRFFGVIRRDNPQFHSFPKSRWKNPPSPDRLHPGSGSRQTKPDQSSQERLERKSDSARRNSNETSTLKEASTLHSFQQLVEKFKLSDSRRIPGLNFVETPKPISRDQFCKSFGCNWRLHRFESINLPSTITDSSKLT